MKKKAIKAPLLEAVRDYLTHLFGLLGLSYPVDNEKQAEPYVEQLCELRH